MLVPGTILLVEDAESDALLIREAFRKARISNPIFRVGTGSDALSYLSGTGHFADRSKHPPPNIVLLDLGLPDTSGFSVLDQIRKLSSEIPVVIVTGSENPQARDDAQTRGANAFFKKTLSFEDLVEIVRAIGGQWQLATPDPRDDHKGLS